MARVYRNDSGNVSVSTEDVFVNAFASHDRPGFYFVGITEHGTAEDAPEGVGQATLYVDAQAARELAIAFGFVAVELENGRTR